MKLVNEHLPGDPFFLPGGPLGVLLSHGWTATTAEVRLLAEFLNARGYTVSCPLLPGHGTTVQEMNRCRWQDWLSALEKAYQELSQKCQKVAVGGESMGALLTLYLSSLHPEIAAVLSNAVAITTVSPLMKRIVPLIALFKEYRYRKPEPWTIVDDRWKGYPVEPFPAAVQLFRLQAALLPRLGLIKQPILILHGRLDTSALPESAEILYRSVSSPVKELHWLEKSHHCLLLDEEWEQAANLTAQFLERNLAS
jgi:carboxylesterase